MYLSDNRRRITVFPSVELLWLLYFVLKPNPELKKGGLLMELIGKVTLPIPSLHSVFLHSVTYYKWTWKWFHPISSVSLFLDLYAIPL